jgi:hypothetical protein
VALVGSGRRPVFLKLDNGLEAKGSGGDLRPEDTNEVSSGGFCEVDDDWLWSNRSISLLTDLFSERGANKALFSVQRSC